MVAVSNWRPKIGLVIPTKGESLFLSRALNSILVQEGDFHCHVHIQDGSGSDNFRNLVRDWQRRLDSERFSISYYHEPDTGAAQAINRGMTRCDGQLLSWLGEDDLLMFGALQTVCSLIQQFSNIHWVTGLPQVISESGLPVPAYFASLGYYRAPTGFSRNALRRGHHATALNHGFIQQEGTFWSRNLWERVGGLDETLKYAFDFDLWTRFAEQTDLVEVSAPLGAFRVRSGQISSNRHGYFEEVARIRARQEHLFPRSSTVSLEPTTVAFLNKRSMKWELSTGRFIVLWWNFGTRRRRLVPVREFFFNKLDKLREHAVLKVTPRLLLVALGKLRQVFSIVTRRSQRLEEIPK